MGIMRGYLGGWMRRMLKNAEMGLLFSFLILNQMIVLMQLRQMNY